MNRFTKVSLHTLLWILTGAGRREDVALCRLEKNVPAVNRFKSKACWLSSWWWVCVSIPVHCNTRPLVFTHMCLGKKSRVWICLSTSITKVFFLLEIQKTKQKTKLTLWGMVWSIFYSGLATFCNEKAKPDVWHCGPYLFSTLSSSFFFYYLLHLLIHFLLPVCDCGPSLAWPPAGILYYSPA